VLAQSGGLLVIKQHLAWLDDVEIGKIKDSRVHQVHRVRSFTICVDSRQPLDAPDKLAIGGRVVRPPAPAESAFAAFQIRTHETPYGRITHRYWTTSFRCAHAGIDDSRVVILCFGSGWRFIRPSAGQHDASNKQRKERPLHDVHVRLYD